MKTTVIALALLTLTVGLAGVAAAEPEGFGHCEVRWVEAGYVWNTGTDLDGTVVYRPTLYCVW